MRKPKVHPKFGIKLEGINFSERWNIVMMASEAELFDYISNFMNISQAKEERASSNRKESFWVYRANIAESEIRNMHLRKLWRTRYSQNFDKNKLYKIDRKINRWDVKLSPQGGDGLASAYRFQRQDTYRLEKGDILMYTHTDELGNVYFSKACKVSSAHQFAFNRDNKQLASIVEVKP